VNAQRESEPGLPLAEITEEIFADFLSIPVTAKPGAEALQYSVTAVVCIQGTWQGWVILSCSNQLAISCAASMFEMPEDELEEAEVMDAWGEVANLVGGALLGHLPKGCQVGLPMTIDGQYRIHKPGMLFKQGEALTAFGEPMSILVCREF
jgi:chemotaxis protein CheX